MTKAEKAGGTTGAKTAAKTVALWLAVTVIVWLITIWQWQNEAHDASTGEIVLKLFVLPVALTGFFVAVLWGVQRLRRQAGAPLPVQGAPAAAADGAPAVPADGQEAEPAGLCAWVLAEAVTLAAGRDADAAWSGLQAGAVRPGLDSRLQDLDGLPVFTARVADLDTEAWRLAHAEVASDEGVSESVLRGLALLEAPLRQMLAEVAGLAAPVSSETAAEAPEPAFDAAGVAQPAHLSGVARPVQPGEAQTRAARAPLLTVRLLLPAHWSEHERGLAVAWTRGQCGGLLDWAAATQAQGVRWQTEPLTRPEALWDEVRQQMRQWSRDPRPALLLLLAVDSAVHDSGVERLQAVGELFTATHQTGKVPGEAGAALLLANAHWPGLAERQPAPVRMWPPVQAARDKSADAAGRVGATTLSAVMKHALVLNQADKDRLLVIADADHRASRTAELFEALQEAMPGMDPMLAVTRVGEACGDLGLARTLVPSALACAALRAAERPDQVAVAAHVQSSHDRVVVALAPWGAQALAS